MARTIADLPDHVRASFPYESNFLRVNGRRMHYVDAGPRDAATVLLLGGNPAWGFLWRDVMRPLLGAGLRVVVPDQIGFGLSEKPHDHAVHTLDNHAANLVALIDALVLKDATFVCHDWGGPTGLAAIAVRPHAASAVVVMSTWAWAEPSAEFHHRVMPWKLMHAPVVGPYLLGARAAMPGRGMYLSVVDREKFAREAMAAYVEVLADADERALTWIWPRSIPLGHDADLARERFTWLEAQVRRMRLPAAVIWGRDDDVFTTDVFTRHWTRLWPHAEGPYLVTGRHFLQEDSGAEIGEILASFVRRVTGQRR
ncbi:alpha/beta fold hydrolase [Amycolatopsis roodepoortensis]|uniref:Haloalkane dehalogenase n=1 Tax=Amycolatopsis roodepoortensis TaxID=700274 RepID=A0ABR9LAN5_9PSEU|nr:alpha/beta fold hydrolase [Amycolatopsis roodepoortensis]MBE1577715.1 haloalkane dehalogenase [Amycolatopsis roodepoortensis]